jgi:Fe-S-cluster containining protein
LLPEEGDDVSSYEHEAITMPPLNETLQVLRHKKNGDCIYLDRDGCSIHERRPHICRIFDCRAFYLSKTRAQRLEHRKQGAVAKAVITAGKDRRKTLDPGELERFR